MANYVAFITELESEKQKVNKASSNVPIQDARHWYRTARWVRRSRLQLRMHPLCAFCARKGVVTAAQIADHITPHKGDANLFWFGTLQSLCLQCHVTAKAIMEKRGYATDIGPDGYPIDAGHPVYRADLSPSGLRRGRGGRVTEPRWGWARTAQLAFFC